MDRKVFDWGSIDLHYILDQIHLMRKTKPSSEDPSPLFLASFRRLDAIKWEELTDKDVTACDDKGRTLLHHCAKEGFWGHLPIKLRDEKYWKPTFEGTTVPMYAMMGNVLSWLEKRELAEDKLTKKDKQGRSLLSIACAAGNLDRIPKESLTPKVLSEKHEGENSFLHLIAEGKSFIDLPPEVLNEALLSLKGDRGKSVYHTLAENGNIWLLPKKLLTPKGLLLEDNQGKTSLEILLNKEDPIEILPKELLTKEFLFKERKGGKALIHSWVKGKYWMNIPPNLLTKNTLKSKGEDSLLRSILSQYGQEAIWQTKGTPILNAMTSLVKRSIQLGDIQEIEKIRQEQMTLETGDHYPNQVKKLTALISEGLTKRKLIAEVLVDDKAITM
jgi:hypothetical protein